jgi:hypothetical protein
MNKYDKMIIAIIMILVLLIGLYLVFLFTGFIESNFPFGALIPGWFAVLFPIINKKRDEEKEKLKKLNSGGS